jgi:hypothetical protein
MPDIRFSSGFILEQFPSGNKEIEEEMCKTEISERGQQCVVLEREAGTRYVTRGS